VKILIFANTIWNILNFREDLINLLINEGYEITILTNDFRNKKKIKSKFKNKILIETLNINSHSTSLINEILLFLRITSKIKKIKPNIIFSFTIKPNVYSGFAKFFIKEKINFFPTVTGLGSSFIDNNFFLRKFFFLLYKIAFLNANKVVFQNWFDLNLFKKEKIINKNNSIIIQGSGLKYHNRYNFNFKKKNKTFLFIGRIIKQKGIIEYLKAANRIIKENINVFFYIIGDNKVKNTSQQFDKKIKFYQNKKIIYLGFYSNKQKILKMINNIDCVILPSYREGLPMSLIEAMSCARPIITTNVPGCSNLVDKKLVNGLICKEKSSLSLYKNIDKFLKLKKSEIKKMSHNSRKLFEKKYQSSIIINKYIHLLR